MHCINKVDVPLVTDEANRVPNDGKVDGETPDTMPGDAPHSNSAKGANKPGGEKKKAKDSMTEAIADDEIAVQGKSVLQGKLTKLAIQIGYAGRYSTGTTN